MPPTALKREPLSASPPPFSPCPIMFPVCFLWRAPLHDVHNYSSDVGIVYHGTTTNKEAKEQSVWEKPAGNLINKCYSSPRKASCAFGVQTSNNKGGVGPFPGVWREITQFFTTSLDSLKLALNLGTAFRVGIRGITDSQTGWLWMWIHPKNLK